MVLISDILRKIATNIDVDDTPTEEEIRAKRRQDNSEADISCARPDDEKLKKTRPVSDKLDYRALPKQRAPRREPESMKKWNKDDKAGLMKEYMHEYRATGKVNQTDSSKSRYVKKTVS